jgi:hypothetical protein
MGQYIRCLYNHNDDVSRRQLLYNFIFEFLVSIELGELITVIHTKYV